MKTLIATLLLTAFAAPVLALETPALPWMSGASADDTGSIADDFDRRSGRCASREGSACGGV